LTYRGRIPAGPPVTVPLEEEEILVPQGPSVAVTPKEEVPPEEEEFPAPTVMVSPEEEEVPAGFLFTVPPEGRGCLVPVPTLVSFSPFFFSQKRRRFFSPFFLINVVHL
jgi:hypothetical protein